tara:strand:- start:205 stop:468 length:264 start_codon:yes stop_codon:yes gene_type:complete
MKKPFRTEHPPTREALGLNRYPSIQPSGKCSTVERSAMGNLSKFSFATSILTNPHPAPANLILARHESMKHEITNKPQNNEQTRSPF